LTCPQEQMNGLLGTTCYDSIVSARVVLGDSNVERRLQDLPSSSTCSRNRPLVTQHDLFVSVMGILASNPQASLPKLT